MLRAAVEDPVAGRGAGDRLRGEPVRLQANDLGDQLVTARDVPVDRGRAHVELGGQPTHGERRGPFPFDEVQGGGHDGVAFEPGATPGALCGVVLEWCRGARHGGCAFSSTL